MKQLMRISILIFMFSTSALYAYKTEADCEEFEGPGQCCKASDGTYHRKAACEALEAAITGDYIAHNNWVLALEKEAVNYEIKATKMADVAKKSLGTRDEKSAHELATKAADAAKWGKEQASKAQRVLLSGWSKIGESVLDFKSQKGKVSFDTKVIKGFTSVKLIAKGAPFMLTSLNLSYETGDKQIEKPNVSIQVNTESAMIDLLCRVIDRPGGQTRLYIKQNGDCCCEDGFVCHTHGTSPANNCFGCGGDACSKHGGFAVRPQGGYGVHRNIKEIELTYRRLPNRKDLRATVEVWGYKSMLLAGIK